MSRGGRNRRPQRGRTPGVSLDSYQAPRISTSKPEGAEEVKRIPLFHIDDETWTVPVRLSPAVGLRYLRTVRERGVDAAAAELLTEAIGADAFDALAECDEMDQDAMDSIIGMVMGIALGSVDPGKG